MFSKKTDNYGLPQWDYADHPDFLNDMNPAYKTIDAELKKAVLASENAEQQVSTLAPIVASHTTEIATSKHQISDLTTRIGNAEHNIATDGQDIDNLAAVQANTNLILAGYSATKTVSADVDGVKTRVSAIESGSLTTLNTEIDTGKVWIDGKKIYRKAVQLTLLTNADPLHNTVGNSDIEFENNEFPFSVVDTFTNSKVIGEVTYAGSGVQYASDKFVNTYFPPLTTTPSIVNFALHINTDIEYTALGFYQDKAWTADNVYTLKLTIIGEYTKK